MQRVKKHWLKLPDALRRVLVFMVGGSLIIIAGIIGPVPGPGGTIIFLLGIAVLASEFTWAERLRDYILDVSKQSVVFIKHKPKVSLLIGLIALAIGWIGLYLFYKYFI